PDTTAAAPPETTPPAPAAVDPKTAYNDARKLYREGDWIAARKQFELARDGGYRPGLFEDSPQKFLDRMDKKEAADRAKHDAEIAAARANETTAVAQADQPKTSDNATPPTNPPTNPPPTPP